MSDDLVKWLRTEAVYAASWRSNLWTSAADRIEQQAATIEEMKATILIKTKRSLEAVYLIEELEAKLSESEALLAKAVKLIDLAVELAKWDLNPKLRDDMIDFTTELKGHNNE